MTVTIPAAMLSENVDQELIYTCVLGEDALDQEGSKYNEKKYSQRRKADSAAQLAYEAVERFYPNAAAKQLRAIADALDVLHETQCARQEEDDDNAF